MTNEQTRPRAFAVWFKDLERWDALSTRLNRSFTIKHPLVRLTELATVRWEVVSPDQLSAGEVQMVDKVGFDGLIYVGNKQQTRMDQYLACPGDLVISKIRARQGSIGLVRPRLGKVSVSIHYRALTPNSALLDKAYAWLALRSSYCRAQFLAATGGAAKGEISEAALLAVKIPLPPLPVQQAIVARWEAAQAEGKAIQAQLEALEGATSRLVLDGLGVPVQEVRALPKAFALMWKELERWSVSYTARMMSGADAVNKTHYPRVTLGKIAQVSYGVQVSPANRAAQHARPYLRVANVQRGQLDLSQIKYINVLDADMDSLRLEQGDLLVCEGNSADLVGRPAIWRNEIPDCVHQNHILKVRVDQHQALPEWVLEYMQTPPARAYFRARAKFTTNLASINSNDLREILIPLPPLDVQHAIVKQVQAQRAEIARLRAEAERVARESKAEVEALILGTKRIAE